MNTQSKDKFDFDEEDAFTEEELADLEALSSDEFELEFKDELELGDIDLEQEEWAEAYRELMSDAEEEAPAERSSEASPTATPEAVAAPPAAPGVYDEPDSAFLPDDDDLFAAEEDSDPDLEALFAEEPVSEPIQAESTEAPPIPSSDTDVQNVETVEQPEVATPPPVVPAEAPAVAAEPYESDYVDAPQEGDHIPVPRINISVFCESEAVSSLIEASAADRRLSKAHVTILMGGIKKAVQHFQHENTPNLLIIETVSAGQQLRDGLGALAEVCDPSTKVIIIGSINDINLYRDLMSRGISEYLIAPKSPLQISRAIASLYVDPSAPPIGRSIVFVGSRGGVGSSTICHNVAWAMAERFKSDTVILDLDLAFGTASLDFEQDPSQGLAEALLAPERLDAVLLDRLLQKCSDRLSLFAAPNVLDYDYDLPASAFEEVLDMVRTGVPNLVVDLPHCWTAWTRHVLQTADDIVITATPDLSSFRNAKNLIESVKTSRANDAPPYLVLNQMGVPKRPEISPDQFAEALEIEPAVVMNWDPQLFGLASTNAESLFEAGSKSKAAESIDGLTSLLMGIGSEKSLRRKLSLKSLFRNL